MSIDREDWPPEPYKSDETLERWLRFESVDADSGRPSRLVSHCVAPYVAIVTPDQSDGEGPWQVLGEVASDYLNALEEHLNRNKYSLSPPPGWGNRLSDEREENADLIRWRDVWPAIGERERGTPPPVASWNLSRNPGQALPAHIVMVATELLDPESGIAAYRSGVSVPMLVEEAGAGYRVTIRSMTAEFPIDTQKSWTTVGAMVPFRKGPNRKEVLAALVNGLKGTGNDLFDQIAATANVVPNSINIEEFWVVSDVGPQFTQQPIVVETVAKARGSTPRFPNPLSYRVVNRIEVKITDPTPPINAVFRVLESETSELVTHVGAGETRVLPQTPPASILPVDPATPDAPYDWTLRRPTRKDEILDHFRALARLGPGAAMALEDTGYRINRCPEFVPEDIDTTGGAGQTKIVHLTAGKEIPLRANEFSAISAYVNCAGFFDMLTAFGIDIATFPVRAAADIQVYYRYGILPGPGKNGRTVNAQVGFDCQDNGTPKPPIRMNLALAELTRWGRAEQADGSRGLQEPLGIASDKRWMLHEFGHYLLAARLGQLEFDFSHSAGDAMAAIACDPQSRLGMAGSGVAESFRGITFPFVFSTRRHDRSPTLGWAWYGALNRSVIDAPPTTCDVLKGYATEQILSSTLFRLYRALGGDTLDGDEPDVYIRERASFLTLYLLIRATEAMGQSPSRAEMLELGMEQVGNLQGGELLMDPQQDLPPSAPQPDGWKGGLTHKVVRWAYETQGMFVDDPARTHNGMGNPPAVDVFVQDCRPVSEMVNANRFSYGAGSYCPVSLDWTPDALWQMPDTLLFGNRGAAEAEDCHLRIWVGFVSDPQAHWGLSSTINWLGLVVDQDVPDIGPGTEQATTFEAVDDALAEARALAGGGDVLLALVELSCPHDRANTDPAQGLGVKVTNLADLPKTPRALTDLVANDNNLGLRVIPA